MFGTSTIFGTQPVGGALPATPMLGATSASAQGGLGDLTGSGSDVLQAFLSTSQALALGEGLSYNCHTFSLFAKGDASATASKVKSGDVEAGPSSVAFGGQREEYFFGAQFKEAKVLTLLVPGKDNDEANFSVAFWYDGTSILAGYTQLHSTQGFTVGALGARGTVQFSGTPFGDQVPALYLLTFAGAFDPSPSMDFSRNVAVPFAACEFTGSIAFRASGEVRPWRARAVDRRMGFRGKNYTGNPVMYEREQQWVVGFGGDHRTAPRRRNARVEISGESD